MIRSGLLIICFASATFTARAQLSDRWVSLGETMDFRHYYDHTTFERHGQYRKIWHLYRFKRSQRDQGMGVTYDEIKAMEVFDCDGGRYQTQEVVFAQRGRVVFTLREGPSHNWGFPPPETAMEMTQSTVCSI